MTNTDPVLVINLSEPWTNCSSCNKETPYKWGLPISEDGQIVPNWWPGEWGGVPACEECYKKHAAWSDRTEPMAFDAPLV